ncbi:MAG TPA: DUF5666 domain-containing protein [bacterium]|nr:DUF5666 domain-containing protein [bacterium]
MVSGSVRRSPWIRGIFAGVILALAWLTAPVVGVTAPGGPAPLAKGWGRVVASGTVAGIDRSRSTLAFTFAGDGRVDWFQGGTAWHQVALTGTRTIRLLGATLILDAGAHAIPLAAVRAGEPAMLWAVARPDAQMLGLIVEVASPQVTAAAVTPGPISRAGVVVGRSGSTVDVLTSVGSRRSIVMTTATVVRVNGLTVPPGTVAPYDILQVAGPLNSDGSLVATRIDVTFSAPDAAQVSGPVEQLVSGLGGLVVADTMISTSADTYVLRGGARADLSQTASGRPMTVYGVPVTDGGTSIGLEARVVVMR